MSISVCLFIFVDDDQIERIFFLRTKSELPYKPFDCIKQKIRSSSPQYQDTPISIGHGATISAPHMHALCLELLSSRLVSGYFNLGCSHACTLCCSARALDVGSGSGYLVAAMAVLVGSTGKRQCFLLKLKPRGRCVELTGKVIGIEHVDELTRWSRENINKMPRPDFLTQTCVLQHDLNSAASANSIYRCS